MIALGSKVILKYPDRDTYGEVCGGDDAAAGIAQGALKLNGVYIIASFFNESGDDTFVVIKEEKESMRFLGWTLNKACLVPFFKKNKIKKLPDWW